MTEELWYHALTFLDKYRTDVLTYDVDQLYEFADKTGILERHKELLCLPYQDNQVDMKIMYYELIKMLLDFERTNHPETYDATKTVGKIEGYQELTNKLQRYLNQRFLSDIGDMNKQITLINQMFGGDVATQNVIQRFEALEQTNLTLLQEVKLLKEQDASMLEEIRLLKEKDAQNEQKTAFVEDQLKVFENAQATTNQIVEDQLKNLTDSNNNLQGLVEKHEEVTVMLVNNNDKQDERLAALENQGLNLDNKLTSLESADVFLQEANRQLTDRATNVEQEAKRIEEKLNFLNSQQQEEIDDKLKVQIADLLKDVVEINQDKNNIYETLNLVQEKGAAHDVRLEELEKVGVEATKNIVLEMDSRLKGINDISNERMKKAEDDIQANETKINSLEGSAKYITEQVNNIITTNITITEKSEEKLKDLENKLQYIEDGTKNNVEKLVAIEEATFIQAERVQSVEAIRDRVTLIDEARQQSEAKAKDALDSTIASNAQAIEQLKKDFEDNINNVMENNMTINATFNGIHIKSEETWQEIENLKNKHNEAINNLTIDMDNEKDRVNILEAEVKQLDSTMKKMDPEIKKNTDRLNELDNINSSLSSKVDEVMEESKNNAVQINQAVIKVSSNSNRIDDLEALGQDTTDNKNKMNGQLENIEKNIEGLDAHQKEVEEKLQGVTTNINNIQIQIKSSEEHLEKKNGNDLNDLRAQIEHLQMGNDENKQKISEVDVGNQALVEKLLGMEQDLTGKIGGLNDNNNQILIRISGLDNDNSQHQERFLNLEEKVKDNFEKIMVVEEAAVVQGQKITNVELLNDKFSQIDSQRQQKDAEYDAVTAKTDDAIQELRNITAEVNAGNESLIGKLLGLQQEVDDRLGKLNENDNQIFMKLHGLENDNMQNHEKLQSLEDGNKNHIEKLVAIQEETVAHAQKVQYVEMLSDRVNQIDDQSKQTMGKVKEDLDVTAAKNAAAIEDLKATLEGKLQSLLEDKERLEAELKETQKSSQMFHETGETLKDSLDKYQGMLEGKLKDVEVETNENTKRLMEIEPETKALAANMLELLNKNEENFNTIKDQLAAENQDLFGVLKNDVDDILKLTEEKVTEVDSHVENLRQLNKKLIDQVREQMTEQEQEQESMKKTNEEQIEHFKDDLEKRITLLVTKTEENKDEINLANLNITAITGEVEVQRNEIEELKNGINVERELIVTKITEQKDTLESFFKTLEEKVETIENTQIHESNRVELIYKQTEAQELLAQKMEDKIKQVEKDAEEHSSLISMIDKTASEKAESLENEMRQHSVSNKEDFKSIRGEMERGKDDLWTLIIEIYSAFRGYTVVLKSEGAVRNHQADTLGVYRMVDSYNDRPVYKQDGGENYIYYSVASDSWLVGTVVGHQYGWLRNNTVTAKDKRWIPDLRSGWEYRPLVRSNASLDASSWATDDGTLRIEPLRDVEKVNEIIRDIKNSKEID